MKILHLIDSFVKGGAEVLLINYIKEFKNTYPESKHYIAVLRGGGDEQLKEEALQLGRYVNFELNKFNFLKTFLKFRSLILKEKIEVIHTHLLDAMLFARIAKPSNVKLVSTYHNIVYAKDYVFFSRWRMQLDKITYRKKYYSIFVSTAVAENIKSAIPITGNYKVLVNFAGREFTPRYKFNPANTLKLISIGNLKPNKNYEIAVLALAELKSYPVELHVYGDGNLREYLVDLIKKLEAKVVLKGKRTITSDLLSEYDAFLMTSLNEGMPIALIEAISTGLPSVLNDLPMLRETAASAAIYYQTNSKESLVNVLKEILNHKNQLQEMANESLKVSKHYSPEKYVQALHSIYFMESD